MNHFLLRISLYDFLSMEIPGWLLLHEITYCLGIHTTILRETIIVCLGYLVGIVIHTIAECCFKKYRNNKEDIKNAFVKCKEDLRFDYINLDNEQDIVVDRYYDAYYYVCTEKRHHNTISILEHQVAFCRSMVIPVMLLSIPICLYACRVGFCCNNCCLLIDSNSCTCFAGILISLVFVSFAWLLWKVAICRQKHVYRSVIEDYEYLKRLDEKRNKSGNFQQRS